MHNMTISTQRQRHNDYACVQNTQAIKVSLIILKMPIKQTKYKIIMFKSTSGSYFGCKFLARCTYVNVIVLTTDWQDKRGRRVHVGRRTSAAVAVDDKWPLRRVTAGRSTARDTARSSLNRNDPQRSEPVEVGEPRNDRKMTAKWPLGSTSAGRTRLMVSAFIRARFLYVQPPPISFGSLLAVLAARARSDLGI